MKVAIYARCSTREQSVDLQLDGLRAIAAQRGWTVVGEYIDQGVSGTRAKRPALDRLMRDVHEGKVECVAVWKFDRFARSMQHLINALNDFRASNVEFFSLRDGVDTSTTAGRMMFGVIASLAEFEREVIVERVRAGMQAAARRGRRAGRPHVRVDVARAKLLLAQGESQRAVAKVLGVGQATLVRALRAA